MRVQHEPRRQGLRYRQARYFLNRLLGMNRRQAALHAGYKELTANNARQVIEGHGLNRASLMRELCQTIEGAEKKGYHDFGEPHFTRKTRRRSNSRSRVGRKTRRRSSWLKT